MNTTLLSALLAVAVTWLLVPSPTAELGRLRSRTSGVTAWAGRSGAPPARQRAWLGLGLGVVAALLVPGPMGLAAGLGAGLLAFLASGLWRPGVRTPLDAVADQQPDVLSLLAVCLEAGAPMVRAVEITALVVPEASAELLRRVATQLSLGRTEGDAWLELAPHPQWGPVARDVARSARSGTALVEVLRVHAHEGRREAAVRATRQARTVGVKSVVPLMVCFLPAFVLVGVVPIIAGLLRSFLG